MAELRKSGIVVGAQFQSYAELEAALQVYQDDNFCQLYKRESRTLLAGKKRLSGTKIFNEKLKYFEVVYSCVHGGRTHRSASKGLRLKPSKKSDCPFKLIVRVTHDGMFLVVRSIYEEHNHERSQELYNSLPRNRSLFGQSRKRAADLLDQGIDKRLVQQQLYKETGKKVDMKILKNIATTIREKKRKVEHGEVTGGDDEWNFSDFNIKNKPAKEGLTSQANGQQSERTLLNPTALESLAAQANGQQSECTLLNPAAAKPDRYQLQHHNHPSLIIEALVNDEDFLDVTLTAQGRSIKAHKSVLSAVSPYFREVLRENPCQHPIIIMPRDMRYDELHNIVQYIYRGEMTVAAADLTSLMKTAEVLQVSGLSSFDSTTFCPPANSNGDDNISSSHLSFTSSTEMQKSDYVEDNTLCVKTEVISDCEDSSDNIPEKMPSHSPKSPVKANRTFLKAKRRELQESMPSSTQEQIDQPVSSGNSQNFMRPLNSSESRNDIKLEGSDYEVDDRGINENQNSNYVANDRGINENKDGIDGATVFVSRGLIKCEQIMLEI